MTRLKLLTFSGLLIAGSLHFCAPQLLADEPQTPYFEIVVLDADTGRGVPLVQLITTQDVLYVTDNAGRIAYAEPGHAGKQVYFDIKAQGYEVPKDGFGISGVRLVIQPGEAKQIRLKRINLAERLYRITGAGLYRDSVLLGHATPLEHPLGTANVVGQDSIQVAEYRGKLYWFWGDTQRISYPLGMYRTAGATSALPQDTSLPHKEGLNLNYFTDENDFARPMVELNSNQGVIWIDGVATIQDSEGNEKLIAHFSRRSSLTEQLEHGMLVYDDQRDQFVKQTELLEEQDWQHLSNHPIEVNVDQRTYFQSGTPFPLTRVPADIASCMNPAAYESWTCFDPANHPQKAKPLRNISGKLDWQWRIGPPVTPQMEARWLKEQLIQPAEAILSPEDAGQPGRRLQIHTGSVHWNAFRQRWIMIASEIAWHKISPSHLGEVWYTEAKSPQGPFEKAVKIATHDRQSFYNACHHPFFNEEGGRVIYFEGTYTNMFTDAAPTPRYNYNQMLYRLDLSHSEIVKVFSN